MLDVLFDGLAAKSDLRKCVSEKFGEHSKAHTERLPLCFRVAKFVEWKETEKVVGKGSSTKGRQISTEQAAEARKAHR